MGSTSFTPPVASSSSSLASSNSLEDPLPSISSSSSSSSQLTSSSVAESSAPPTTTTPSNPNPNVIIPLRAFSPPKWIFSHPSTSTQSGDDDIRSHTVASSSTSFYDAHRSIRGEVGEHYRESFPAYAPRRPGIRFVKAKTPVLNGGEVGGEHSSSVVEGTQSGGEIAQVSKGSQARGLYETLVGINAPPRLVESPAKPVRKPSKNPPSRESKPVDLDLTSDQFDSDSDSVSDENEDIIILDPLTRLPEPNSLPTPLPRTKRTRPNAAPLHRAIHELLPSQPLGDPIAPQDQAQAQAQGIVPLVPPTYYAIPSTNIGWRILQRQGWKEGGSLGVVQQGEGGPEQGRGLKVPLKASDKFDRKGLGNKLKGDEEEGALKERKKEKEKERKRRDLVEVEKRGKGSREIALRQRQEMKDRKELLAYMNRD
ncbi:BZ3500_MvSof-1268-A1-R1_Chr10-1g02668 [Microbotryum saponariae]|uniref:BZ3500_MvSof-1268-A1-R1_Chr10-1g02668 protein n=1 Tax=Microbotryum saponariae TaxID=289078 RepID=A0A2X0NKS1_9BASI|nr:BZ3500_MvSof-1268-A1-R1_Chr10-1g02668 [Microbotryum saponariae]SDA06157.1 BZ3501_MvSof-1269-A2-R1_Chr10-1g02269 [Microbotryum saponariae]